MISFIIPSIRPKFWNFISKEIHDDNFQYEIIFIGPKHSYTNSLPPNCKFIKTNDMVYFKAALFSLPTPIYQTLAQELRKTYPL